MVEDFLHGDDFEHISEPLALDLNLDETFMCGLCGEICVNKQCLLDHEKTHEIEQTSDCRKLTGSTEDSCRSKKKDIFVVIKNNNGKFECSVCKKTFATKNEVKEHYYKLHCGSRKKQCLQCEFSCYSKCALDVHTIKCHTKRYACEICGKMFSYKYQLKTHINGVHLNIRNHTCDVCGKSFKTRANFDTHMARHMDVRNFRCPYCPHRSRTNHDLSIHIRRHTGERPFSCDVCGRAFAHSINKIKHERSVHGKSPARRLIIRFPDNEVVGEDASS